MVRARSASGSRRPAEEGVLVGMTAGAREAVERVAPLLRHLCATVAYCGPIPSAISMKLAVKRQNEYFRHGDAEATMRATIRDAQFIGELRQAAQEYANEHGHSGHGEAAHGENAHGCLLTGRPHVHRYDVVACVVLWAVIAYVFAKLIRRLCRALGF